MSLSDLDVKKVYPGNGSTTTFAITFAYTDSSEVVVILRDETSGVTETTQTLTTHYSISSGNVVMVTAPSATQKLVIKRSNPLTQTIDYVGSGELGAENLETNLDKITKIAQELNEKISRCVKIPETYPNEGSGAITDLSIGEPSASKLIAWNSSADALEAVSAASVDLTTVPVTTKGDLFGYSTAAARLAVGSNGQFLQVDSAQSLGLKYTALSFPISQLRVLPGGPTRDIENNMSVLLFADALTQQISMLVKVPTWWVAGRQLSLKLNTYSPGSSGTNLISATTTLLEPGSSAASSTSNQHSSTNSAVSLASANRIESHSIDLTDGNGQINSTAVAAGDLLLVVLSRDTATDSDTSDVRLIEDSIEVITA